MLVPSKCIRRLRRKIPNFAPPRRRRGGGSAPCLPKSSRSFIKILSKRAAVLRNRLFPAKNRNLGKLPKFRHTKLPKLCFRENFHCPKWQPNAIYRRALTLFIWKYLRVKGRLSLFVTAFTFGPR